jgi:hypothetical protein
MNPYFYVSRLLLALLGVMCTTCASYKVVQLPTPSKEGDVQKITKIEGVRFNRPAPYFLVGVQTADAGKAASPELTITLIYLPDRSATYAIQRKSGWGKSETTVKLQDGWNLLEYGSKFESQMPETITALTSAAGLFFPKTNAKGSGPGIPAFPAPGLWKINFDRDGQISGITLVPGTSGQ